jgi:hypothetical protein
VKVFLGENQNLPIKKFKNRFFSLENANIFQLFLLDKLVSGQGLKCKKNIFWIATLYRKIDRKITFDFMALYKGPEEL